MKNIDYIVDKLIDGLFEDTHHTFNEMTSEEINYGIKKFEADFDDIKSGYISYLKELLEEKLDDEEEEGEEEE